MTESSIFPFSQPGAFADPLTEVLRNAARALLVQAVEAEVAALLSAHADKLTDDGRQRLVRHGSLPEREIMTGIGPIAVRCPRVRDRGGEGPERVRFSSAILPPCARRSKSLEVLIPILYLKGVSTGDFEEALTALLGKEAGGLSPSMTPAIHGTASPGTQELVPKIQGLLGCVSVIGELRLLLIGPLSAYTHPQND